MDRTQRRALLRKAVKGCTASALTLIDNEPILNAKVDIVLTLCRQRAPRAVVRGVLMPAIEGHPQCIQPEEPGSREILRELLGYAQYKKPPQETLTLWRGAAGVDADTASDGYFWGTERHQAVGYAFWRAVENQVYDPIVLCAQVPRSHIGCVTQYNSMAAVENFEHMLGLEVLVVEPIEAYYAEPLALADAVDIAVQLTASGIERVARGAEAQSVHDAQCEVMAHWLSNYRTQALAES